MSRIMAGDLEVHGRAKIIVFGVGGGGGNAVNNMIEKKDLVGVQFIVANTDQQALEGSSADQRLPIGARLTGGLGAGAKPEVGKNAAMEDQSRISELVKGSDMVFVTAGMGGGTGTGAAPVIARAAREAGALTVGVVTKPFSIEGMRRMRNAEAGIAELEKNVDSLIVIPNDRLMEHAGINATLKEAFAMANDVLYNAVKSISSLVVEPGLINLDFADVRRIMESKGRALMGTGEASGEGRAIEAAQNAITSYLLEEDSIKGATGILVNVIGGPDLRIHELNEAVGLVQSEAHESAEIIMGAVIRDNMTDRIKLTVIATGFDRSYDPSASDTLATEIEVTMDTAQPAHWNPPPIVAPPVMSASAADRTRKAPPTPLRRDPIVNNPWSDTMDDIEREQPAYIRKSRRDPMDRNGR